MKKSASSNIQLSNKTTNNKIHEKTSKLTILIDLQGLFNLIIMLFQKITDAYCVQNGPYKSLHRNRHQNYKFIRDSKINEYDQKNILIFSFYVKFSSIHSKVHKLDFILIVMQARSSFRLHSSTMETL